MRITQISAANILPVKRFDASNLSDLVVIAGPNGVGKTRLLNGLLNHFKTLQSSSTVTLQIQATDKTEVAAWGQDTLDTSKAEDATKLRTLLQQNRSRRNFKSSVIHYESNRSIQNVKPLSFQFEFNDPWEESVSWELPFGGLANRWQDTQHAIFKKIQSQKMAIANRAIQLKGEGHSVMNLEFSDPLEPFRESFERLLGPKALHNADIQNQRLMYREGSEIREVASLSSGEREVLTITFDFLLRKPSHSIVFFDEPELHLHPELLSRLVNALRSVGESNQFVFISHSPDIISSSLNESVLFLTPPKPDDANQAVRLDATAEASEALHRLGQSVGVVSLGRKIVLIEGADSSLDKQTYSHLLRNRFPSLVLQASGGKGNLQSFDKVATDVLDRTLWGIRFYMLADRDAAPSAVAESGASKLRVLGRYHLENYFLDADVLASCFEMMEPDGSWLRSRTTIESALRGIAEQFIAYATALFEAKRLRDLVGNVDLMPKGSNGMSQEALAEAIAGLAKCELDRVNSALQIADIASKTAESFKRLSTLLKEPGEGWKNEFPGKPILASFAAKAKIPEGRLKTLYIARAEQAAPNPFQDIIDVFAAFAADGEA